MACGNECIGEIVINTGLTDTNVSYIDCNGDLVEFSAVTSSGGTYLVNYCNGSSISGDTITQIKIGKGLLIYYNIFRSCCSDKEFMVLTPTVFPFTTGQTINIIDSLSYSGNVYTGCFSLIEGGSFKVIPPLGYDTLTYIGYTIELPLESKPKIYKDCVDCLVDEPCPTTTTTTTTGTTTTTTTTTIKPQPPINVEPRNECDVITIFPMGATCNVLNPTDTETFDGVASLEITGGTPPYTISWDNKNHSNTITNIGVGEYNATISDFYNDFTIVTTCVLTAVTPTSTTTTSTTTLPTFGDLCLSIDPLKVGLPTEFYNFEYNGYINGKPSWETNDGEYIMYWNTGTTDLWVVSAITSNNTIALNYNSDVPPLNGWQLLGTEATILVVEGSCAETPIQPLRISISKDDPDCEKAQNGSIVVQAFGGTQPYSYSIDGGTIYQTNPIFNNLAAGIYNVIVIDDAGNTTTSSVTLTNQSPTITTYVVSLIKDFANNTFNVSVSPPIPLGVTIPIYFTYTSNFKRTPTSNSASYNGDLVINVDSSPITQNVPTINTSTTTNNDCANKVGAYIYDYYTTQTNRTWPVINMTNGTTIDGSIYDIITNNSGTLTPEQRNCYSATRVRDFDITLGEISGCAPCCTAIKKLGTGLGLPSVKFP